MITSILTLFLCSGKINDKAILSLNGYLFPRISACLESESELMKLR